MIKKHRKKIVILIKTSIFLLTVSYIYWQLHLRSTLFNPDRLMELPRAKGFIVLVIAVPLLLAVNLLLEAIKWRFIVKKIEAVSLWKSFKAIFSGACIGIFTPNRIGDYGGRILFLQENHRVKGVLITWLGSITQLFVTVIAGCIALIFYMAGLENEPFSQLLIYICLMFGLLFAWLYINIPGFYYFLRRFARLRKYDDYLKVFTYYSPADLGKIFLLSLTRYLVFSFQYLLLVYIFTGGIPLLSAWMMIALIFFVQSTLPSFAIAEVGIRGAAAVYFLGQLSRDTEGIVLAAVAIWLTNIMLPAVGGLFVILKTRFLS